MNANNFQTESIEALERKLRDLNEGVKLNQSEIETHLELIEESTREPELFSEQRFNLLEESLIKLLRKSDSSSKKLEKMTSMIDYISNQDVKKT